MSGISIGIEINKALEGVAKGKVYPVTSNFNVSSPLVVYYRSNLRTERDKDGTYIDIVEVSIMCIASTYEESISLAEDVRKAMFNHRWSDILIIDADEALEETNYIQLLTFEIRIENEY